MVQQVEQTRDEKISMYMKLSQIEIINMLIECQNIIQQMGPIVRMQGDACDICGRHPLTIIQTKTGRYCPDHVQF